MIVFEVQSSQLRKSRELWRNLPDQPVATKFQSRNEAIVLGWSGPIKGVTAETPEIVVGVSSGDTVPLTDWQVAEPVGLIFPVGTVGRIVEGY